MTSSILLLMALSMVKVMESMELVVEKEIRNYSKYSISGDGADHQEVPETNAHDEGDRAEVQGDGPSPQEVYQD